MSTVDLAERVSKPVSAFPGGTLPLLVDDRWVEAASGKAFPVYNPATGQEMVRGSRKPTRRISASPCRRPGVCSTTARGRG